MRIAAAVVAILGIATAIGVAVAWEAMGTGPTGVRAERMAASGQWREGVFVNPQPLWNDVIGMIPAWTEMSPHAEAEGPLPVATDTAARLAEAPGPLRVTWLGHSTTLIEIGGRRVLTDPIFGSSPFPIPALGPQRWYDPPIPLEALDDVDVVLISHDHYDHLDFPTIARMKEWKATFITPLGVGAHLEYWGIPADQVFELDWWQDMQFGDLRVVATPARHASGRQVLDQNRTLWAGYALISPERRVMFSGDTGLFDDMATIGERYGPFDLVMIEVGAYHRAWPDWHIGPEQALVGHAMMRGKRFMPIHWGLFNLALHSWTEPAERLWVAAERKNVPLLTPRPGEVIDVDNPPPPTRWWPDLPWETAEQHPVIATKNGDASDRYPVP